MSLPNHWGTGGDGNRLEVKFTWQILSNSNFWNLLFLRQRLTKNILNIDPFLSMLSALRFVCQVHKCGFYFF